MDGHHVINDQHNRFSATNCAKLYDLALSGRKADVLEAAGWRFRFKLTTKQVWDGWTIFCLLEDHTARHIHLELPHSGAQKDRLQDAMQEHNERFVRYGQPELLHACDRCMRVFKKIDADGDITYGKLLFPLSGSYTDCTNQAFASLL